MVVVVVIVFVWRSGFVVRVGVVGVVGMFIVVVTVVVVDVGMLVS